MNKVEYIKTRIESLTKMLMESEQMKEIYSNYEDLNEKELLELSGCFLPAPFQCREGGAIFYIMEKFLRDKKSIIKTIIDPCPFCKHTVTLENIQNRRDENISIRASCVGCGALMEEDLFEDDDYAYQNALRNLATKWNRRA